MTQHNNFPSSLTNSNTLPNTGGAHHRNHNPENQLPDNVTYLKIQHLENTNHRLLDLLRMMAAENIKIHQELLQEHNYVLKIIQSYSQELLQFYTEGINLFSTFSNPATEANLQESEIISTLQKSMKSLNNIIEYLDTHALQQTINLINTKIELTNNLNIAKSELLKAQQLGEHYKSEANKVPFLNAQVKIQNELIARYESIFKQNKKEGNTYSTDFINHLNSDNILQESQDTKTLPYNGLPFLTCMASLPPPQVDLMGD